MITPCKKPLTVPFVSKFNICSGNHYIRHLGLHISRLPSARLISGEPESRESKSLLPLHPLRGLLLHRGKASPILVPECRCEPLPRALKALLSPTADTRGNYDGEIEMPDQGQAYAWAYLQCSPGSRVAGVSQTPTVILPPPPKFCHEKKQG